MLALESTSSPWPVSCMYWHLCLAPEVKLHVRDSKYDFQFCNWSYISRTFWAICSQSRQILEQFLKSSCC